MKKLLVLTTLFLLACAGGGEPPVTPTPDPGPTVAPTPTPWVAPPPVEGVTLIGDTWYYKGKPVDLWGISNCDEKAEWSIYTIEAVQEMLNAGANWTHIRMGPFWTPLEPATVLKFSDDGIRPPNLFFTSMMMAFKAGDIPARDYDSAYAIKVGDDGRLRSDLDTWMPDYDENGRILFWGRTDRLLRFTSHHSRFMVVQVDIFDGWIAQREHLSPLGSGNNIQKEDWIHGQMMLSAPGQRIKEWVYRVVERTGWANVEYQIGNETFPKYNLGWHGSSKAWECLIRLWVRDACKLHGYPIRMVGTNSHDEEIEAEVDFINRHRERAQPRFTSPDRRVEVNEYNDANVPPTSWKRQAEIAWSEGTTFHAWRCELDDAGYADLRKKFREFVGP